MTYSMRVYFVVVDLFARKYCIFTATTTTIISTPFFDFIIYSPVNFFSLFHFDLSFYRLNNDDYRLWSDFFSCWPPKCFRCLFFAVVVIVAVNATFADLKFKSTKMANDDTIMNSFHFNSCLFCVKIKFNLSFNVT